MKGFKRSRPSSSKVYGHEGEEEEEDDDAEDPDVLWEEASKRKRKPVTQIPTTSPQALHRAIVQSCASLDSVEDLAKLLATLEVVNIQPRQLCQLVSETSSLHTTNLDDDDSLSLNSSTASKRELFEGNEDKEARLRQMNALQSELMQRDPLLVAVYHNNLPAVRLLLAKNFPVDGISSSSSSSSSSSTCSFSPCSTTSVRLSPLYLAASLGNDEILQVLIESGGDVNATTEPDGQTALYAACRNGAISTVRLLAQSGANASLSKHNGMTPLHVASQNGFVEICEILLENLGANPVSVSETFSTPLHLATFQKNELVVKLLLAHGADVDAPDENGWTAIHVACQVDSFRMLETLVDATVLQSSSLRRHACEIAAFLLEEPSLCKHHPEWGEVLRSALLQCMDERLSSDDQQGKQLRRMLRLNRRKNDGYTPLMISAKTLPSVGDGVKTIHFLLTNGACPTLAVSEGVRPILLASKAGSVEVLSALVDCLDDDDITTRTSVHGWNAIHWAAKGGHWEALSYLLSLRKKQDSSEILFDVDTPANNGMTALYIAAHHGHLDTVRMLVNVFKASPLKRSAAGVTPFFSACKHGRANVVRFLCTVFTSSPASPLGTSHASSSMQVRLQKCALYQFSISTINVRTHQEKATPLQVACRYDRVEVVRVFVEEFGVDPLKELNENQWLPTHFAAACGAVDVFAYFASRLGPKACLDPTTKDGLNALHLALMSGSLEMVRSLCQYAEARILLANAQQRDNVVRHESIRAWLVAVSSWSAVHFYADARNYNSLERHLRSNDSQHDELFTPTLSGWTPLSLLLHSPELSRLKQNEARRRFIRDGLLPVVQDVAKETLRLLEEYESGNRMEVQAVPVCFKCIALVTLAMLPLSKSNAHLYPIDVRRLSMCFLIVAGRKSVPDEIAWCILSFIGRN